MNATSEKHSEQIEHAAREWFVLLQSDGVTDAEKDRFDDWLQARPEHRLAYLQLDGIWGQLAMLSATPEGARLRHSVESVSASSWFGRFLRPASSGGFFLNRPLGAAAAFVLLAAFAGLVWLQSTSEPEIELQYATDTSEVRVVKLLDGSEVTLGAESEVLVTFDGQSRTLELLEGEAFFDVASDPQRPFVVEVNDIRITVVGTQFDVRKRYAGASVAVLEGQVQLAQIVGTRNTDTAQLLLSAGEQVLKPQNGEFTDVKAINAVELGAWRNGRLIFKDTHLIDVITDANRYFGGSISLEVRDIYEERVTLTLRTDQIDQLPDMLANVLPIEVRKSPDGRITLIPSTGDIP